VAGTALVEGQQAVLNTHMDENLLFLARPREELARDTERLLVDGLALSVISVSYLGTRGQERRAQSVSNKIRTWSRYICMTFAAPSASYITNKTVRGIVSVKLACQCGVGCKRTRR